MTTEEAAADEVVRAPDAGAAEDPYARKWWVLLAVCLGLFMVMIDATIVNVSIPTIMSDLGADLGEIQWVLNAYTLTFASLLIAFGRLGDMFGRKRMFLIGLLVFVAGSVACGLSGSATALILSRVGQAFGAAFMMPATLSLTAVSFPPHQRGMAMGIWGAVTGIAATVGPILGGTLTEALSWPYIFFVNVPISLIALPFAIWAIRESRDAEASHSVDYLGVILSIAMLVAFNYGMIDGPDRGWDDPLIAGLLAGSAVLLGGFVVWQKRAKEPLMDLGLFRDRTFSAGNAVGAILMFGMMGVIFLLPIFMQVQLGFSAIKTGLALAPMSLAIMFAAPASGRLSDTIGSRRLIFVGLMTVSVAIFWLSAILEPTTTATEFIVPFIVFGLGMGLTMAPMTSAVMASAPSGEEGAASGVLSTMRQVGAVLGIAILGAYLSSQMTPNLAASFSAVEELPEPLRARIVETIESSEDGGMSSMMASPDIESFRDDVTDEEIAPIIELAIEDAVAELPAPARAAMTDEVLAAMLAGMDAGDAEGDGAGGPPEGMGAELPPGVTPEMMAEFGESVETAVEARFAGLGEAMEAAGEEAFVASIADTFRIAAIVALFGALMSFGMANDAGGRDHGEKETVAVH